MLESSLKVYENWGIFVWGIGPGRAVVEGAVVVEWEEGGVTPFEPPLGDEAGWFRERCDRRKEDPCSHQGFGASGAGASECLWPWLWPWLWPAFFFLSRVEVAAAAAVEGACVCRCTTGPMKMRWWPEWVERMEAVCCAMVQGGRGSQGGRECQAEEVLPWTFELSGRRTGRRRRRECKGMQERRREK